MSLELSSALGDEQSVLALSRAAVIFLLLLYIIFLLFKLHTHPNLFHNETEPDNETEQSVISFIAAVAVLIVNVALVVICAEKVVGSVNHIVETTGFLLAPSFVIIGWDFLDKSMILQLELLPTVIAVFATLIEVYIVRDGKSNCLKEARV
ncbi:vacuolar calcium ion transporter [Colletotrichum liriopes]|uniref:Vacuolar calcium ion transporter n=1 Tax=Colletotrichum liriopes TaxID=708192 RepID=A0AA37LY40_9PEZI|nr:vacuolar calcium ion transporter [Colletotrichum liriopes]